jgi:hypothetical protein
MKAIKMPGKKLIFQYSDSKKLYLSFVVKT